MLLQSRRLVGVRSRQRLRAPSHHVDSGAHPAAQERLSAVDTRVQERDRDAAAVLVRQRDLRPLSKLRTGEQPRAEGRRKGRTDRVDTGDVWRTLEQGDAARVERRGEAVDRVGVAELRLHDDALYPQARDEQLLRRERALCPAALLLARRESTDAADAICERRGLQQDDYALADGDTGPLRARKP